MTETVLARHQSEANSPVPGFFLMTDENRLPDPGALIASLPGGSAVVVRSRAAETRVAMARRLKPVCQQHSVVLLISCSTPGEASVGDGVHIPEAARLNWKRHDFVRLSPALVTTSAHSLRSAQEAANWGADAVMLSPVLATRSHPDARSLGWWRAATIARALPIPAIALGGLKASMNSRAHSLGFAGIAGIDMFAAP